MAEEDDDGLSERAAQSTQPEDEDSAGDDDFLANLEELPDTDELEEDDVQGEDSDEQPYEAEIDVLHLGADGCSVASGPAAEAPSSSQYEEQGRQKRRKLDADTPVSAAEPTQQIDQQQQQQHQQQPVAVCSPRGTLNASPNVNVSSQQLQPVAALPLTHGVSAQVHMQHPVQQFVHLPPLQQQHQHQQQHSSQSTHHTKQRHKQHNHQELLTQLQAAQHKQHVHQPQQLQPARPSDPAGGSLAPTPSDSALPTTSVPAVTAASVSVNPDNAEEDDDAICLRTRSKHPLASEEFDPDLFDRLLAEFDPDVEPLIDDAMYQHFLQSLQAEAPGQTDPYSHALHFTPAAAHSPAPGGLLPPASSLAAAADTGLTGAPAAVAAAMAAFADDEDDDDEFQLDPLDWLVDDERDAEEEERLAQFVQVKQTHPTAIAESGRIQGKTAAAGPGQHTTPHQGQWPHSKALTGHAEGVKGGGERRRTQREAARRAAERIALEQQQHRMGMCPAGGAGFIQPLIPAAAAGWPLSAAAVDHPGAAVPMQLQQQQQMPPTPTLVPTATAGGHLGFPGSADPSAMEQAGIDSHHHQQHISTAAGADSTCLPQLLTLTDHQLKQLYHQISLHTQLLTQLYVLTARDPSEAAQAVASAAGQMLGTIRRLHAAAAGSYRGGQMAELLQQAFFQGSAADQDHHHDNQDVNDGDHDDRSYGNGQLARVGGGCKAAWVPAIRDMSSLWDTCPLRLLDDVVFQLRVTPMSDQPLMEQLLYDAGGGRKKSGNSSSVSQQAAREVKQVVDNVLGGVVRGTPEGTRGYEQSAWPVITPKGRSGVWTTAEDDLMWLGLIRFHTGVRAMQDTATMISQELLPCKTPATVTLRYKNLVNRKDATAKQVLKYALMGRERPAAWEDDQDPDDDDCDDDDPDHQVEQDPNQSAAARLTPCSQPPSAKLPRGPMWAAAELGAALTAAFAAAELGIPSAAAEAAAGVLMGDPAAVDADVSGSSPAGVSAGEQLLRDLVSGIALRLPFKLPAPLDVPSASSVRRGRRNSLMNSVDPAAGQQLLLSLAARQILQGDTEEATAAAAGLDVTGSAGGVGHHEVASSGAAANIGAQGLLAGMFAADRADTAAEQQQQPPNGAAPKPALGPFTALLQQSPVPAANPRKHDTAAADCAADCVVIEPPQHNSPSPAAHGVADMNGVGEQQVPTTQQTAAATVTAEAKGPATHSRQQATVSKASPAATTTITAAAEDGGNVDASTSEQQRRQSPAAALVADAATPWYVDTDDEDMDFEGSAVKGKQLRQQQQGKQPCDIEQQQQQLQPQVPGEQQEVTTAAAIAAYAAATAAAAEDVRRQPATTTVPAAAVDTADTCAAAAAGPGKQLRRSLFGAKKLLPSAPTEAPPSAAVDTAPVATLPSVSIFQPPQPKQKHAAPSGVNSAAPASGNSNPTTVAKAAGAADIHLEACNPNVGSHSKQQQQQGTGLQAPPAKRITSRKSNINKAVNIAALPPLTGLSVFSASVGAASTSLPSSAAAAVQLPAGAGCVGVGLDTDSCLFHQQKPAAASPQKAMRYQPGSVVHKRKLHQHQQQQRPANSTMQVTTVLSPGRLLVNNNGISGIVTSVLPRTAAAAAAATALAHRTPVRESITARAARRLAEAEAQDAAVACAAAAAQQPGSKSAGQRKGRRRAVKAPITNNNNTTSLTSSPAAAAAGDGSLTSSAVTTALGVLAALSGTGTTAAAALPAAAAALPAAAAALPAGGGVSGLQMPRSRVHSPSAAGSDGGNQDLMYIRSLLETCQSLLQQQMPAASGQLGQQQQQAPPLSQPQQQAASSSLGLTDLQLLAGVLQQNMSSGSSNPAGSRVDSAAVHAALGAYQHSTQQQQQQQQFADHQHQQQDLLQLVQQLVSHQQQLPSHIEANRGHQAFGTQQHSSQQRQFTAHPLDPGIDTANCSALQALAEAAAKAAARIRR